MVHPLAFVDGIRPVRDPDRDSKPPATSRAGGIRDISFSATPLLLCFDYLPSLISLLQTVAYGRLGLVHHADW